MEGDSTYLYHALQQIIGELKVACQMISMPLHHKLPGQVRRIKTTYHRNPVFRLLTGTPGFSSTRLVDHAIGTASYFLAEQRQGLQAALNQVPFSEQGRSGWQSF